MRFVKGEIQCLAVSLSSPRFSGVCGLWIRCSRVMCRTTCPWCCGCVVCWMWGFCRALLDGVVGRHGALRTRFVELGGEPVQEIVDGARVVVDVVDRCGSGSGGVRAVRMRRRRSRRPFDLSVGPLMRCVVVRLGDGDQLLVFTVHHIVFDGWSRVCFSRICRRAFAGGGARWVAVAQFVDLVEWERGLAGRGEQDRLVGWWRERLAGAPTVLDLVTDRLRPRCSCIGVVGGGFVCRRCGVGDWREWGGSSGARCS